MPGVTPYEVCFWNKPYIGHIHIFWCVVYMSIPSVNLKKLEDRSRAVIQPRKEHETKAYRMYDPEVTLLY